MERIVEKALRPFTVVWRALALTLVICATGGAWAEDLTRTNPVTGETETYTWKFTGTDTWANTNSWENSSGEHPSGVPAKSGDNTWDPILFDGNSIKINASMSVEGWDLCMGLYNGANVTMNTFVKYQGDKTMWMTVDETSQLTVGGFGGGNIIANQVIKLSVAKANGITWNVDLTSVNANNTFEYYLKGAGSVSYQAVSAANHKIKMADVTLTGTSQVTNKTLVSFTSSSCTFTADATIKRLNSSGTDLNDDAHVATVTSGATTLTTSDAVGTCELVQTSTGIVLYWVDGDPEDLTATVYKPSININFTNGSGLTTSADVGISEYAIPGTSWNNLVGNNGSLTTVTGVNSNGVASAISGAKVTISGTRGYWTKNGLDAASDLRQAYIDDADGYATPTVVVEGIPYYKYKLVLYFSNDTDGRSFGHLTVNGTNYRWDSSSGAIITCSGVEADCWGSSDSTAYTEGGNYLVFPEMDNTDGTLTVVGHRWSGTQRMGVAAIQIVEVKPEIGENDLEIEVDGDTTYTVSEGKTLSGTVYLTGSGTLTLSGDYKIEAGTIEVSPAVTLNVNTARLDADTYIGAGVVVYDGVVPPTGKGWTDSENWTGTVWLKNKSGITGNNNATTGVQPNSLGNTKSKVKFSGVSGWLEAPVTYDPEIVLENAGYDYALQLINGNSPNDTYTDRATTIKKLSGSGTLGCGGTSTAVPTLKVYDASGFTGSINSVNSNGDGYTGLVVVFCDEGASLPYTLVAMFINSGLKRTVYVASGKEVTLATGATWTAKTGFIVAGTLVANGTLASSHETKAVSGSGTVVFNGKLPSPTGDAWWKNSDWDGTVQVASVTDLVGGSTWTGSNFLPIDYGNSESVLELKNCTGWLPNDSNYQCTVPLKVTGTFTINNGISGSKFVISKLSGSGAIYTTSNTATVTIQVLNADDFTGYVQLNQKRVIFGETIPETFTSGQIYVGSGFSFTVPNSNAAWYGTGGITLDGELKATALSNFGGGTTITTSDTGVFTLTDSNNTNDSETDYARITGTGTLRYADVSGKWRALSKVNFPTNMICENNLSAGLILTTQGDNIIGSLAGSGQMRSDWGGSGNTGDRDLLILQARDTTYSGLFASSNDRVRDVYVKPGATSAGTLTLSGTQTVSNDLVIESGAAVNLTGTWVGAATVAGTFGGTGTLDGALTFSDGATFKANTSALTVSGAVTFPTGEGESVSVDVSGVTIPADGLTIMTATSINDIGKLSTTSANYFLVLDGATLKVYPVAALVYTENDATTIVAYPTIADAVSAAYVREYMSKSYDYIVVNQSGAASAYASTVKIKPRDGVTVTLNPGSEEFGVYSLGDADGNGIITYTSTTSPITYTWNVSAGLWELIGAWRYTDSNSIVQYATRHPMAGDTVVFTNSATVTLGIAAECATMTVGGSVGFTGADKTLAVSGNISGANAVTLNGVTMTIGGTVTDTTVVLASEGSSVTAGTSSGLSEPTTTVENAVVQATNPSEGTICYTAVMGVAVVDNTPYLTLAEAIAAAEEAGIALSEIEVLDSEAPVPAGYYVEDNIVCRYQAAIVNTTGTTTNYYKTAQLAINSAKYPNYGHFEVYYGTDVALTLDLTQLWAKYSPIKFKCLNGSTISVSIDSVEYELTPGDAVDGIVTYTKTPIAATFTWTGATSALFGNPKNWSVGGSTATRAPDAIDNLVIETGATIGISSAITVSGMSISGSVTFDGAYTLTSNSAIALPAGASITLLHSAAISPVPTAADPVNYRVRTTATGYTVVEKVGTIFSVY